MMSIACIERDEYVSVAVVVYYTDGQSTLRIYRGALTGGRALLMANLLPE